MKVGIPLASLTSLSALIHPDVAEKVLDGYWRKDGEIPTTYTINLELPVRCPRACHRRLR